MVAKFTYFWIYFVSKIYVQLGKTMNIDLKSNWSGSVINVSTRVSLIIIIDKIVFILISLALIINVFYVKFLKTK